MEIEIREGERGGGGGGGGGRERGGEGREGGRVCVCVTSRVPQPFPIELVFLLGE